MDLCDTRQIKSLLAEQGFKISKSLGQNFLIDRNFLEKITSSAGIDDSVSVLEIGPGLGSLTRHLAPRAKNVLTVEIDRALSPILAQTLADLPNATVVFGDILDMDLRTLCAEHFGSERLCAVSNLPYYITTRAVTALLEARIFSSVTLTLQREAAAKLTAVPGDDQYCLLSALTAYFAVAQRLFSIPARAFFPQPGVDSQVVKLNIIKREAANAEGFVAFARAAFSNRRKTLINNLLASYKSLLTREEIQSALTLAHITHEARAENVCADKLNAISESLLQIIQAKGNIL